ncbi:aminotransferase class V-fold PLP-dependent enzyme [Candidatus Parcubacteria bacterium]|nr:MAG: aminotransferase class V-fold PLP-dependent enzyme [Candidatus Parcubacteria bacterium]
MKVNSKSFYYSPVSHSKISLIYPWNDWIIDLFALVPIKKQRNKIITSLESILNHRKIFFTSSGSAALTLAIKSLHLAPNSEVLITSFNCPAVIDSIIAAGAVPVLIDINSYGGINIKSARKALSNRTKAIVATNVYGLVDNLELLNEFCKNNNLYFINDLAQTFENLDSKKNLNKFGDISIYSFSPGKHLFALGGGCLMVNNNSLIKYAEKLYPNKVDGMALRFFLQRGRYYFKFLARKYFPLLIKLNIKKMATDITKPNSVPIYRMSDSQLFSLLSKLKTYKKYYDTTQENFELLRSRLKYNLLYSEHEHVSLPLYATIIVKDDHRYKLASYLDMNNIPTTWNYLPLYYFNAYKKYKIIDKKMVEILWRKTLSIPFRYPINTHVIEKIISLVNTY